MFTNKKCIIGIVLVLFLLSLQVAVAKPDYVPGEIIVKFRNNHDDSAINLPSKMRVQSAEKIMQARNPRTHDIHTFYRMKISGNMEEAIRQIRRDPNVEYAEPNYIVHTALLPNDVNFSKLYGLHNTGQTGGTSDADIDAAEAWDITTGSSNVVIAVIDTGVDYNHQDLSTNIYINPGEVANNGIDDDNNGFIDDSRGWDFANNDNNPMDDQGHGTHVSGTIGAAGNNNIGVVGVNWNVKILPVKFLDSFGSGTTADAIEAIEYATLMKVDVMSNSWGGTGFSQAMEDAIKIANDAGILFVAAAGNSNVNNDASTFYPANYNIPNVISVAATDHNDLLASFSNYGAATVHLGAPGVAVFSTVPNGSCQLCSSNSYASLSGTSMATPHVSGAVGLIKAAYPNLKSDELKARLLNSVDALNSLNGITMTGGRLNAYNSLESDTISPSKITDLAVASTTINSALLSWTAPGDDDNTGKASRYEIRYSISPINDANWQSAVKVNSAIKPQAAGAVESLEAKGLEFSTNHYFAVKAYDNVGNPSALSNLANGTTKNASILFADNMENGINNWQPNGLWHQETKRYSSAGKSWAYNNGAPNYNYDIGDNQGTLTSPVIDISSQDTAILRFKYWYSTETLGLSYDKRLVQVGVNGVFLYLTQLSGDNMNVWNDYEADISQYSGKSIQIRFLFDTGDSILNNFEGWYIDDLELFGDNNSSNSTQPNETQNLAPIADAGSSLNLTDVDGNNYEMAALNGTGSYDPDGNITAYEWKGGSDIIGNSVYFTHNFSVGAHVVILTVTDDKGAKGVDNVTIVVNQPPQNIPPVANAGLDKALTDANGDGFETATLNGSSSFDTDGVIVSYLWKEGNINLSNYSSFAKNFAVGNHTLTLIVTDNKGAQSTDNVLVNVLQGSMKKIFNDTFNRPNSNAIGNGWAEVSGDFNILNNQLRNNGKGTHLAVANFSGSSLNVSSIFTSTNNNGGPYFGIVMRYQDSNNYYLFYRTVGGSSTTKISRFVNGVEKVLVSNSLGNPGKNVPFKMEAIASGNTLTLYVNGVKKSQVTDTTFTSGKAGVYVKMKGAYSHIIDDFFAMYS